ncbi:MAG: hypothetical protein NC089_11135, partial [Bacteroides sp.]|nr:hypothetical protein [Bacteroides sp.]MCM1550149.1 hypothetical protein [Clostridium sp.]
QNRGSSVYLIPTVNLRYQITRGNLTIPGDYASFILGAMPFFYEFRGGKYGSNQWYITTDL